MAYKSSLFIDAFGYLYYSGIFNGPFGTGTVDFDPGPGVANLIAPSSVDNAFFVKYGIGSGPLPVELISFTGESKNKVNYLHWTTASEINNDHFDIERSSNGIEFKEIGAKEGNGNSVEFSNYEFEDPLPSIGINYYRLKQVDFNGAGKYSESIAINHTSTNNYCWAHTSAESGIYILHCLEFTSGVANIYDGRGNLIEEKIITNTDNELRIDLTNSAQGIYLVRIFDGNSMRTIKLMKY